MKKSNVRDDDAPMPKAKPPMSKKPGTSPPMMMKGKPHKGMGKKG
jgi:hypothetical protein